MKLSLKDIQQGFGNGYSVDLRDMIEAPKVVLKAYCTSNVCCSYQEKVTGKNGNLRIVTRMRYRALKLGVGSQDNSCPDCNSALLWKA